MELVIHKEKIEKILGQGIESLELEAGLLDAVKYCVFSDGKRLRPLLIKAFFEDLRGENQEILLASCAVELLHCASLVHDDLPALDNDDFRRGIPTCHKKFDEATAILVGDLLVAAGFDFISRANLKPEVKNYLNSRLSEAFLKLCRGQHLDLIDHQRQADLLSIHRLKTGALFEACCLFVFSMSESDSKFESDFRLLGTKLGEFFQVTDDYLDIYGSFIETGRFSSSDQKNNRVTFFTNSDPEIAKKILDNYHTDLGIQIDKLGEQLKSDLQGLNSIVELIFSRTKLK